MHSDAAQSVGKIPTRLDELPVDLLTVAGHKVYAPKGVGALYVRQGLQLEPVIYGGGEGRGGGAWSEKNADNRAVWGGRIVGPGQGGESPGKPRRVRGMLPQPDPTY